MREHFVVIEHSVREPDVCTLLTDSVVSLAGIYVNRGLMEITGGMEQNWPRLAIKHVLYLEDLFERRVIELCMNRADI